MNLLKWPLVWRSTWAQAASNVTYYRNKWLSVSKELGVERNFRNSLLDENARLRAKIDKIDQRAKRDSKPGSTKCCSDCGSEMIPMQSTNTKVCSNGNCGKEIPWPLEAGQVHTLTGMGEVEPFREDRSNDNRPLD